MKNERRHELQNNELAAWLTKNMGSAGPYVSWGLAAGIAIVLVVVFMNVSASRQAEESEQAWSAMHDLQGKALAALSQGNTDDFKFTGAMTDLSSLADEHKGSELGTLANLAIADTYFERGALSLRRSRQISNESYENAARYYSKVLEDRKATKFLLDMARFRRGRSYEWRNQIGEAVADYQATTGPYESMAQAQLVVLESKDIKQWYDEFDLLDLGARPTDTINFPQTDFDEPDQLGKPGDLEKYFDIDTSERDAADSTPSERESAFPVEGGDATTDPVETAPAEPTTDTETGEETAESDEAPTTASDSSDATESPAENAETPAAE